MIIQKVKDFNREQKLKYKEAVDKFEFDKGGFPCLSMYIFIKDNGQERKRGFVISDCDAHYFRLTRREVAGFKA